MNILAPKLFKDVAFVLYPVSSVKTARRFYEDILGLTVTAAWDNQWVEYEIGSATLAIAKQDKKHRAASHGPVLALEVADFDAVLAQLKAKKIPLRQKLRDAPTCRGCKIQDPDGNELILHQKK